MSQDIAWDRSELETHVTNLQELSKTVDEIATKTKSGDLGSNDMFGKLMGALIIPILGDGSTKKRAVIDEVATFTRKRTEAMAGALQDYADNEQDNIAKAAEIIKDLEN